MTAVGAHRDEIAAFIAKEFPQTRVRVLEAGGKAAKVVHEVGTAELRPGGTVSGPVMMATADVALYVALLAEIGIVPLAGDLFDAAFKANRRNVALLRRHLEKTGGLRPNEIEGTAVRIDG